MILLDLWQAGQGAAAVGDLRDRSSLFGITVPLVACLREQRATWGMETRRKTDLAPVESQQPPRSRRRGLSVTSLHS